MPLHLGLWLCNVFFGGPCAVRRLCMSGPTFHGLCFKCASGLNCIPSDSLCAAFGVLGCWLACSSFSISVWRETCFPQLRLEGGTARTQLEAAAPRYAMAAAWRHLPKGPMECHRAAIPQHSRFLRSRSSHTAGNKIS